MQIPRAFRFVVWGYVGLIGLWFLLRLVWFDQFVWLALLNTLAFYLLLPTFVFLVIAIVLQLRHRSAKYLIAALSLPTLYIYWLFWFSFIAAKTKATSLVSSFNPSPKNISSDELQHSLEQSRYD